MDTATIIIIVILVLALLFFGVTIMNSDNAGSGKVSSGYSNQYYGGGCGR